jgi:hypothetical protein
VWLAIDWGAVAEAATVGARLSVLLNPVPFDRESESIESLRGSELGEVLAGDRPLTVSHPAAARSSPFDPDRNQEQSLAARYALLADDRFCIHGPPGTGKTRTLLEVVCRAAEAGEDVPVCADSNQALDNLVVGESAVASRSRTRGRSTRTGNTAREFTLRRATPERSRHDAVATTYRDVAARADVVAATNSSAARLHREFDLLVLDEAAQSTCTASCIPLARPDRVVLAGDHRTARPRSRPTPATGSRCSNTCTPTVGTSTSAPTSTTTSRRPVGSGTCRRTCSRRDWRVDGAVTRRRPRPRVGSAPTGGPARRRTSDGRDVAAAAACPGRPRRSL